jgi:2-oxoisovalerate dehydrogenase E1 component alpha subunit
MAKQATRSKPDTAGLDDETLLDMYRQMVRSRKLDERAWVLHRQGKIAFHISAMGHEACQAGAAFAMRRGFDYLHPYYRDLTFMLCLGLTPRESMLGSSGARANRAWRAADALALGLRRANVITSSTRPGRRSRRRPAWRWAKLKRELGLTQDDMRVTIVCFGEGTTAQGDFHEGLNWAGIHKLPVIFRAKTISTPCRRRWNGGG